MAALMIILSGSCTNKKKDNSWSEMNLKGKVKSIKESSYTAVERFGVIEAGERKRESCEHDFYRVFNESGSLTEESLYDSRGTLIGESTYDSGRMQTRWEYFFCEVTGEAIGTNDYDIDYTDGMESETQCLYDESENRTEENYYDSDGKLKNTERNVYDSQGNVIEESTYDSEGILQEKVNYEYEYDEKGNWLKQIKFEEEKPSYILIREIEYF